MTIKSCQKKRRIVGIMGGSFNPVHIGHTIVASYIAQWADLDQVWLSLSPANPLKEHDNSTTDSQRLKMLKIAIADSPNLAVTDIELTLPRPSYTARLLDELSSRYPDTDFKLIIGSDNWQLFDKWHDPGHILKRYGVIIYPRPGYPIAPLNTHEATIVDAPGIDLSSTFIRQSIKEGRDMNYFLPAGVFKYIKDNNLYHG